MTHAQTITSRVIETVARHPDCLLEELVLDCPELTWNQVFLEVDRMSRTGQVRVTSMGEGTYTVTLPSKGKRT